MKIADSKAATAVKDANKIVNGRNVLTQRIEFIIHTLITTPGTIAVKTAVSVAESSSPALSFLSGITTAASDITDNSAPSAVTAFCAQCQAITVSSCTGQAEKNVNEPMQIKRLKINKIISGISRLSFI